MGSGASTLTTEQKAEIAKEMKEKYESLGPDGQATAQEDMMQHYEVLVAKVKAESESAPKIGLPAGKKKLRKKIARMRSFENGKFLLENVAQPKKEPTAPDQDFWDSVSTQPTCLICKMVFVSETKRDTHMKYSEVHLKNVQALEALEKKQNEDVNGTVQEEVKVVSPELPSFRCRELYSGSKFYWRLQDTIEYHIYLHIESNDIEVIPYDNHKQLEYPRLYFSEEKLYHLAGPEKVAARVKLRMEDWEKENVKNANKEQERPKVEDVTADERRQFVCALLMAKLQLTLVDKESKTKTVEFKMAVEADANPLLASVPDMKPVLVKRRRLSTTEEIEAALQSASELELQVNVKLHEAEELEGLAHLSDKVKKED